MVVVEVVEVVDVDVVADVVGAVTRGASVTCEDEAPSPPHAVNARKAATIQASGRVFEE